MLKKSLKIWKDKDEELLAICMKISKKWGHKISKIVGGQNGSRVHRKIGGVGGYLGGH